MIGKKIDISWLGLVELPRQSYECGYCGSQTATASGFSLQVTTPDDAPNIRVCNACGQPTYFYRERRLGPRSSGVVTTVQMPPPPSEFYMSTGNEIIDSLFEEAAMAYMMGAYSAAVMVCRTLIMHVALDQGDEKVNFKTFAEYCDFLEKNHHVHKNFAPALDMIRISGNKATHDLTLIERDEANKTMKLLIHILSNIYSTP